MKVKSVFESQYMPAAQSLGGKCMHVLPMLAAGLANILVSVCAYGFPCVSHSGL